MTNVLCCLLPGKGTANCDVGTPLIVMAAAQAGGKKKRPYGRVFGHRQATAFFPQLPVPDRCRASVCTHINHFAKFKQLPQAPPPKKKPPRKKQTHKPASSVRPCAFSLSLSRAAAAAAVLCQAQATFAISSVETSVIYTRGLSPFGVVFL